MSYIWPIIIIVASNIVYRICSKSVPQSMTPFTSLTVTYCVSAVLCAALYFALNKDGDLTREFNRLKWETFGLGVVIKGLEMGIIYAYKAGWEVSLATVVRSAFPAVTLIVAGLLVYHKKITWNKMIGVVLCLAGLVFINK